MIGDGGWYRVFRASRDFSKNPSKVYSKNFWFESNSLLLNWLFALFTSTFYEDWAEFGYKILVFSEGIDINFIDLKLYST